MTKKFDIGSLVLLILGGLLSVVAMILFSIWIVEGVWNNNGSLALILIVILIYGGIGFLLTALFLVLSIVLNRKHKNKIITILAISFLAGFVVIPTLTYGISTIAFDNYYVFSINKWAKSNPKDRGRLIDSFLAKYDLYTFDKSKVEEYLGDPDIKEDVNDSTYLYDLGLNDQLINPNHYYLKIDFNTSNMVINYNSKYILTK